MEKLEEERREGREEGNGGRKPCLLEVESKVESSDHKHQSLTFIKLSDIKIRTKEKTSKPFKYIFNV